MPTPDTTLELNAKLREVTAALDKAAAAKSEHEARTWLIKAVRLLAEIVVATR